MFSDIFIRRPILATVCSLLIILAGAIVIPTLPIARYPELTPPSVTRDRVLHRRQRAGGRKRGHHAARAGDQRRRGHEYMQSSSTNSGVSTITVTFDDRPRSGSRRRRRPEPRQPGARPHAGRRAHERHHGHEEHGRVPRRARFLLEGQPLRRAVPQQLRRPVRHATRSSACPASATSSSSASASSRCGCGSIRPSWRRAASRAGDVVSALREQNVQVAAGALGDAPAPADQMYRSASARWAGSPKPHEFEDIVVKAGKDGALVRIKDIGRVELGAETYSSNLRFGGLEAAGVGIQLLPTANAIQAFEGVMAEMQRLEKNFPPGPRMAAGVRQRRRGPRVDHRGPEDAGSRRSGWSSW